jgi:hypothetical protein
MLNDSFRMQMAVEENERTSKEKRVSANAFAFLQCQESGFAINSDLTDSIIVLAQQHEPGSSFEIGEKKSVAFYLWNRQCYGDAPGICEMRTLPVFHRQVACFY